MTAGVHGYEGCPLLDPRSEGSCPTPFLCSEKGDCRAAENPARPSFKADWFDNPHMAHGGTYGVRGPKGLVIATNSFNAGWKKAQELAAAMNAAAADTSEDTQ